MKYKNLFIKSVRQLLPVMLATALLIGTALPGSGSPEKNSLQGNSEAQQGITVSGKVTSGTDKSTIPGVSILIKGTAKGTVTNADGGFSIEVPGNKTVLVFSFVGFKSLEVPVSGQKTLDVVLSENVLAVDEVVVTALGITRKEKSLGFAVAKVSGEDMSRVVQENAINALTGKVAGVQINSTGGTGSSVSMVIRGAKSLSNDNQPLFVIDGVPVSNTLNNVSGFGSDNQVDYGNAISDVNSNDIESVSVLKGASAAALYGSRAGNGVVLITTKSGKKNKGIRIDVSSNTVFDQPYKFWDISKGFANGYLPYTPQDLPGQTLVVDPSSTGGSGIPLDRGYFAVQWDSPKDANGVQIPTELVSHPNNVKNFVQTGITTSNEVAVSNNTEALNYRIGVSNMTSKGIVPNSDLFRNNLTTSASIKVRDNFTISSNININKSWSNNRPAGNRGTNPMQWAYAVPQNTDIRELKSYWAPGKEGIQQNVPYVDYNNPYFLAHQVNNSFSRDRVYGNLKADWQITKELSVFVRYALDQFNETRESKIGPGYTGEPNNGAYGISESKSYQRNTDFLATYAKQVKDFSISVSAGSNALYTSGQGISNSSQSGLIIPNVFSISNIKSGTLSYGSGWSQKAIYSVYGLANLGWKDRIYLDLTARNDWSSTLPVANQSYFYPSASLSILVDKILTLGENVSLLKVRGGWAKVGNDTDPYQLMNTYGNIGQWGDAIRLAKSGTLLTPNLKPEEATTVEGGIDVGLFHNRLRFEGTYYQADNRNQILRNIPIASSTGSDAININAGLLQSKGWELTLGGTPIKTRNWMWDISANLTRNRTTVKTISPGIEAIKFWEQANGGAWSYVGDEVGAIYDASMLVVKDKNSPYYGYPIISQSLDYEWQRDKQIQEQPLGERNKIGNYNPRFILGINSSLTYRSFALNFTLDWRCGGQFISQTERYGRDDGLSGSWLKSMINPGGRTGKDLRDWLVANQDKYIRNGFHVVGGPTREMGGFAESVTGITLHDGTFDPGVIAVSDGHGGTTYKENLGEAGTLYQPYAISNGWDFAKDAMFDADFVKLREVSISYKLPGSIVNKLGGIKTMAVSVYSRNIMIWTKAKIGIDPERAFQVEQSTQGKRGTQFMQGIERYNLDPWVIPVGVKFDLTF
ncbi:MAG: SusC/RagA family TonB-linked outer membrane protein [Mariniphaga sp.]